MNDSRVCKTTDPLTDRLDELADVAKHWQRNREKGRTPQAIHAAMIQLAGEIVARSRRGDHDDNHDVD